MKRSERDASRMDGKFLKNVIASSIYIGKNELTVEEVVEEAKRHWGRQSDPLKMLIVAMKSWTPEMLEELKDRLELVPFFWKDYPHFCRPIEVANRVRTHFAVLWWRGENINAEANNTQWVFQFYDGEGSEYVRFEMVRWKLVSVEEGRKRFRAGLL